MDHRAGKATSESFVKFVASNRERLEGALNEWLPISASPGTERFNQALRYAIFPGGKRFRPFLTILASRLGGASGRQELALACAIEFIHNSSLVLDDLPGMDDAEFRRNQPALHLRYGEGLAILVAVALLNQAYALFVIAGQSQRKKQNLERLIMEATQCIGSRGMIAGQAADLDLSGPQARENALSSRESKTTGLMRLMMTCGGMVAAASDLDLLALATYGESLGRAYQVYDDLIDKMGDSCLIGKNIGQDSRHRRPTFISGLGIEDAEEFAADLVKGGKNALMNRFGDRPASHLLIDAGDHFLWWFKSLGAVQKDASV